MPLIKPEDGQGNMTRVRTGLWAFVGAAFAFGIRIVADLVDSTVLGLVATTAGIGCIAVGAWCVLFPKTSVVGSSSKQELIERYERFNRYLFAGVALVLLTLDSHAARIALAFYLLWGAWHLFRISRR